MFDRDDCAELVRRNACGRRIDDAGHAGRQRGRFLGRRGRDRADLGPAAAEDAARGGGVRFVRVLPLVDVPADASKDAEDDRTEEDEKNANKSPRAPLTSFVVARAHVAGLPGFARIAFVLFVRIGVFPDVAGLAGLDELVRLIPNWCARPMFDVFSFRAAPAAGRVPVFPWDIPCLSFDARCFRSVTFLRNCGLHLP